MRVASRGVFNGLTKFSKFVVGAVVLSADAGSLKSVLFRLDRFCLLWSTLRFYRSIVRSNTVREDKGI